MQAKFDLRGAATAAIGAMFVLAVLVIGAPSAVRADAAADAAHLAEVGAKLSNPVSDVWALFTEFDLTFNNGNANQGDDKAGGAMLFQPILPVPLTEKWKIIVRPTVPFTFTQPFPQRNHNNTFDHKTGIGDVLLPLPVSPALDNWIVGLGPTFSIPTATNRALGRQQFSMGPTGIVGYKTKDYVVGVFPQYFFKIADRGDQRNRDKDASNMSLLYFGFLNLANAWQIGFNPSVTYDHKQKHGNKWNVPIGLVAAKTTKIGSMPVKFQLGLEYSVVSQDDFGKKALFKLNVIPVIPALISSPIFGP
jgi:hypothetical protein